MKNNCFGPGNDFRWRFIWSYFCSISMSFASFLASAATHRPETFVYLFLNRFGFDSQSNDFSACLEYRNYFIYIHFNSFTVYTFQERGTYDKTMKIKVARTPFSRLCDTFHRYKTKVSAGIHILDNTPR